MFKRFLLIPFLIILWAGKSSSQYILMDSKIPIIEKMTSQYKGRELNLSELDRIVKEIAQDGLFQVVSIEKLSNNNVIIRAEQSNKIQSIVIQGNASYSQAELTEAMNIENGQVLSELEIEQSIDRIKEVYRNSGFYNFHIGYQKIKQKDGVILQINIDEQDFCIIEDIDIFSKNNYLNIQTKLIIQKYYKNNYKKETSHKILKDINDLLLEHRFLTAKVENTATIFNKEKTKVKLKFTITNPTQFEFVFHGNQFFSHFDLIKQSKIGGKFLYLSDSSSEIMDAIVEMYLKAGFPRIQVTHREKYFSDLDKKVFVFSINEGPRVRIGKVEIVGKLSKKKNHYLQLFNQYLAEEAHSVYFVQKDIEHAAGEMVTHLKRNGHLQAELLSVNYEINNENKALITIQIDEGILTYVRQILFMGSKSFSNIELREQVGIQTNKPLNIIDVENSFEKIEFFYKNRAYLEFKIKNRNASVIQYKPDQPYADIVYQIDEGPKIRVKDIRVRGLQQTKEYVVTRELDFNREELLTIDKVSNSIDRLEKTGLFGKVNIRSLEQESKDPNRTIVVEVEERKPGVFSTGIGLLNEGFFVYRGYIGALYNNIGGKARGISSRVDLKYLDLASQIENGKNFLENRIALSYYEPFIFKDRVRGRISLIREQQVFDYQASSVRSTNDIILSTEKEYSRHFRLTYNVWGFSNQETFNLQDNPNIENSRKILNIGTTGPIFEFDYRNDQFLPTDGSYSRLEFEYSDPILGSSKDNPNETGFAPATALAGYRAREDKNNEIQYFKTTFSTTHYTPLTKNKRWVWANSLRGGYLRNVSSRSDSGVPQVKSFFLGGSSTIRGFAFGPAETVPGKRELCINQGLIDYGEETINCDFGEVFVRDDSAFFLVKSELRFPISGAFGGLIFYDGGGVYLGDFHLEDAYRDAVGLGFRYDTPVGSFIVEFGYKLDRKLGGLNTKFDKESDLAFHLAIGTF